MQEEVNQKTVALSIRTTKLTGKVLAAALGKVVRALQKHHRKALTPQGRQSVKKLMNHYGGKSAMPYVGAPKDFDRIAKEFHVDYAFHKVSPGHYLLFFKANQADAITAAFQKYSAKVLNKEQDKASILGQLRKFTEQIRTQAKEKAKSSVSDFKRGMVQEQQSRQTGRLEKQEQHRQNIADKRMELQKAQETRQAQRKADGSATTGATRPHERPATASTIPKPSAEKTQEVKRPATATTSKASEPVKTNVIKERPLSSGASDRKATQSAQPVHMQNVEKVVSQETRQNYTKDRRTKVQQTQTVQKNQQTTEKTRNLSFFFLSRFSSSSSLKI